MEMVPEQTSPQAADTVSEQGEGDGRHDRRRRNRQAIIDSAIALVKDGNDAVTRAMVSSHSSVSSRTTYRLFERSSDFLVEASEQVMTELREQHPVEVSPEAAVETRIANLVETRLVRFAEFTAFADILANSVTSHERLDDFVDRTHREDRAELQHLFRSELAGAEESAADIRLALITSAMSHEGLRHLTRRDGLDEAQLQVALNSLCHQVLVH